jgi:membrane protein DedA with SNARE-associated domain
MEETGQQVFSFLSQYGYWLMLPLMIIEGPVATIAASMLAKLGAFNIWMVFVFSLIGDMLGDMFLYWLGYRFGMGFVRRIGRYIGITEKMVLRMEGYFSRHGGKTIFTVKSTTGLCWAAFTAAGIVKMNFGKFVSYSFLGGLVWSGFLVAMGYFYGYLWKEIRLYITWAGWMVTILAVATFIGISLYKYFKGREILRQN